MALSRAGKRRIESDMQTLMDDEKHQATKAEVPHVLFAKFSGPSASIYENGTWKVRVSIPDEYPRKPPTVTFLNKIYHPNVDEQTGILSIEAISEHWKRSYHLTDLFQTSIPELLTHPNTDLAVNKIASAIYMFAEEEYKAIVKEYIRQYAKS